MYPVLNDKMQRWVTGKIIIGIISFRRTVKMLSAPKLLLDFNLDNVISGW